MIIRTLLAVAVLSFSAAAHAQTFLVSGWLDDGDAPANGAFDIDLAIVDDAAELWSESQAGVVVLDGFFAIDVGAVEPINVTFPTSARLSITIDGDPLPGVLLARLARAATAGRAATANHADIADAVDGLDANAVVTRAALAQPGGAAVPFSALTGLGADVLDGDDGEDLTASGGLSISNRILRLDVPVATAKLKDGVVDSTLVAPNSVNSAKIADGAITGAKIADGTLRFSDLAADVTSDKVAKVSVFTVTATNCTIPAGGLSTSQFCSPPRGACTAPLTESCNSSACAVAICNNTAIGSLVSP